MSAKSALNPHQFYAFGPDDGSEDLMSDDDYPSTPGRKPYHATDKDGNTISRRSVPQSRIPGYTGSTYLSF